MTTIRDTYYDTQMLAAYFAQPPSGNAICPACGGGTSKERSFRVWREDSGLRACGKCFRASCGFFRVGSSTRDGGDPSAEEPTVRPYTGPTYALPTEVRDWWTERYGCPPRDVMHDGNGWLILPVSGPSGRIRGDIKRRPNSECPLYVNSSHYDGQPKVVTYFSAAHPGLAWYTLRVGVSCSAVLVEDQISAMRVAASGLAHGVALLGTGMNYEKVRELQETVDNVVIALDADATSLAFQHAAKWGAAFKRCRVLCLREDIKDAHNMEHVSAILASL